VSSWRGHRNRWSPRIFPVRPVGWGVRSNRGGFPRPEAASRASLEPQAGRLV
jgi:hypothetical protein